MEVQLLTIVEWIKWQTLFNSLNSVQTHSSWREEEGQIILGSLKTRQHPSKRLPWRKWIKCGGQDRLPNGRGRVKAEEREKRQMKSTESRTDVSPHIHFVSMRKRGSESAGGDGGYLPGLLFLLSCPVNSGSRTLGSLLPWPLLPHKMRHVCAKHT